MVVVNINKESMSEYFKPLLELKNSFFSVTEVAKKAYEIYLNFGKILNKNQNDILLTFIAMEEGEEFELKRDEILNLIDKLSDL